MLTKALNLAENMNAVTSMMRSRLDTLGYTEGTVTLSGDRRVVIEIPNISDPEEAVQKLGSTAKLQFIDHEGTVVLEGTDIEYARAAYGDTGKGIPMYYIALKLTDEAVGNGELLQRTVSASLADGKYRIRCLLYIERDIGTTKEFTVTE